MSTDPKATTDYALATGEKEEPVVVEGVAKPGDEYGYQQDVKAHKCCGGCCDMRRAVIIVNIVNSVFLALGLMSFGVAASVDGSNYDDDEVKEAYTSLDNAGLGVLTAIIAVKLVISLLGIYGAFSYNVMLVGVSCAAYCLEALLALVTLNLATAFYCGFFAYPHFFFIREVRAGIMTKETYSSVEHSCCCV